MNYEEITLCHAKTMTLVPHFMMMTTKTKLVLTFCNIHFNIHEQFPASW